MGREFLTLISIFKEKVAWKLDKYDMKISMEQIQTLVEKKKYKQASDLAKTLDWHKVKDWPSLSAAITAHEKVGELEEARDMAILAYNRNLGGKKLVYELTTLMIKLKQFDDADQLFLEYEKMASRDVNKYVLYYELRKAEGAQSNELVEILEDYKSQEVDEKYMYELAKLYSKTGRKKECVKACDEIALLFQDGTYVVKALKMKQFHGAKLTESQQKKLDEARARKTDMEITREILFQKQMDSSNFSDKKEAEIDEMLDGSAAAGDTINISKMMKDAANQDDDVDYTEFETELDENGVNRKLKRFILEQVKAAEEAKAAEAKAAEEAKAAAEAKAAEEAKAASDNTVSGQGQRSSQEADSAKAAESGFGAEGTSEDGTVVDGMDTAAAETGNDAGTGVGAGVCVNTTAGVSGTAEAEVAAAKEPEQEQAKIGEMPESLKDLIANAKKKIESSYDKITKESEEEARAEERAESERQMKAREDAMEIEAVAEPTNNIYDTQNLQAEIAKNLSKVLDEEDEEQDVEIFRPNPVPAPKVVEQPEEEEDDQIEGQMSIADWMASVREEKYGSQNTKEYSKSELDRLLDEKEENSAAYEKILEERKQAKLAAKAGGAGSVGAAAASEGSIKDKTQFMLMEAKTDLAVRTGKASQKLEEAVSNLKEAARAAGEINKDIAVDEVAESVERELTAAAESEVEKISLDTAQLDMVPDNVLAQYVEEEMAASKKSETRKISPQAAASKIEAANPVKETRELKLNNELSKFFKKYKEMPGVETELADYFQHIQEYMSTNTSMKGNIIISGNSSSDKYDLAKAFVRAINSIYKDNPRKIARTTGESINQKGLKKALPRLMGSVLVVEGAGVIQPTRISEMLECMTQNTGRMIVVLVDSDSEMNVLLNFNPQLSAVFDHRFVLKQYTVNELVEMAKKFARRRSYEVDDDALLELYLKIDRLHGVSDNIRLDDVKEIINQAIAHSEKRASRKLFKGIKKKHTENGDLIYLTEADFRD